ncbi:MAG: cation transporter [Clostridiales bacterium]|nr:cation transporter [Clostridiales bacterium]
MERDKVIIRASVVGIVTNVMLALFKTVIGTLTGSIAVVLDGVNNFSDVLSSVITIIGAKLASKRPDRDHPLGHGRIEYLAGMAVSIIILLAGWQAFTDSIDKLLDPGEDPSFGITSLVIIGVAVFVKIFLGLYVRKAGRSVNSSALIGSGTDALFDAAITSSVLVSALLQYFVGIRIEAYVGLLISVFIFKAGLEMLLEAKDNIIGRRTDKDLKDKILDVICDDEAVLGAYDLFLHNYGPTNLYGSVHVEVPDVMQAKQIDSLERSIAHRVYEETGVILTAIGIYSVNTSSDEIQAVRANVLKIVHSFYGVLQTHGFYLDEEKKTIHLDVILDFALQDGEKEFGRIRETLEKEYPDYTILLTNDIDV